MALPKLELLRKIRMEKQYGDNKAIAARTGFTEVYVSMCLNPRNDAYNEEIIQEAVVIVSARQIRLGKQLELIKGN